jgi:uncharacterized protein (DUF1330 family)
MIAALLLLAQAVDPAVTKARPLEAPRAAAPSASTCDQPVIMVIAGPTRDRARMQAYGKAIADSGLYKQLGGYYLNAPKAAAQFEGAPPAGYTTLMVRFPCLENARAFWNSETYQQQILPLRQNPSAGDYFVTVYPEIPLSEDMVGKVGDNGYRAEFDAAAVPQVKGTGQ